MDWSALTVYGQPESVLVGIDANRPARSFGPTARQQLIYSAIRKPSANVGGLRLSVAHSGRDRVMAINGRLSFPRHAGANTGRIDMSESADKENEIIPDQINQVQGYDEHMEDEEKIIAGRHDVNYPAMLTKDVPGG
jgi:hypothetical protein